MNNTFNMAIATEFSLESAVFVQQLAQWSFVNLANKRNIHDGYCWSYNTIEAYEVIFPCWTRRQLERIIRNAIAQGLIIKSNYNKNKYDRTCWYALTYKAMKFYPELVTENNLKSLYLSIPPNGEMGSSNEKPAEIDFTEWCNGIIGTVEPIPTNNTTNKNISKDILGTECEGSELNDSKPTKQTKFSVKKLLENNPHGIEEDMLKDWIEVRQSKRNKITATAWNKINKTLTLIQKQLGISPLEAFETMVASGWQSLEVKYFEKPSKGYAGNNIDDGKLRDKDGNTITWE